MVGLVMYTLPQLRWKRSGPQPGQALQPGFYIRYLEGRTTIRRSYHRLPYTRRYLLPVKRLLLAQASC